MKCIEEYKTVGEWFSEARHEGYSVTSAMCHGITVGQKELDLSFPQIFELFTKHKVIIKTEHTYIYDMRGHLKIKASKINKPNN